MKIKMLQTRQSASAANDPRAIFHKGRTYKAILAGNQPNYRDSKGNIQKVFVEKGRGVDGQCEFFMLLDNPAEFEIVPDPNPKTIDVTPTWAAIIGELIQVGAIQFRDEAIPGREKHAEDLKKEILRCAALADERNEIMKTQKKK